MASLESHHIERAQAPRLRYALLPSQRAARAAVLITPGYLEHVGRYEHVMQLWNERGYLVAAHDPRGQGLSEGRRGHVERFSDYVDDVFTVLDRLQQHAAWSALGPPIIAGHSMGGLITTHVALSARVRLRGAALLSPFFGLALQPPAWKVWVGRRVSSFWPTYTERSELKAAYLTHDPERAAAIEEDPLSRERVVTARWFTEMEAAQAVVHRRFAELDVPVTCLAAGNDYVADVKVTRQIFAAATRARTERTLRVVDGCYHELHQETDWRSYMNELADHFDRW